MLNKRISPAFLEMLDKIDLETLENSKNTIYALDSNLKFLYFNPQYVLFANENGAAVDMLESHPIGSSFIDAIKGEKIKKYYLQHYTRALSKKEHWTNEHECSSYDTYRNFFQRAYPIHNGDCLIIVNSLVKELPMKEVNRKEAIFKEEVYLDSSGFINQCSNCRRTQRVDEEDQWDWIPDLVITPQLQVSHTICPICFDYYWKYHEVEV